MMGNLMGVLLVVVVLAIATWTDLRTKRGRRKAWQTALVSGSIVVGVVTMVWVVVR